LTRARIGLWLSLVVGLGIIGGVVYMMTRGWFYISVPLLLAVVGSIGHAAHRVRILCGHLSSLDRRHVPLPKATVHVPGARS